MTPESVQLSEPEPEQSLEQIQGRPVSNPQGRVRVQARGAGGGGEDNFVICE